MDNLHDSMIFEYTGVVTQLAATSEVASIGFQFYCPVGERIEVLDWQLLVSDQDAAVNVTVDKYFEGTARGRRILVSGAADNAFFQDASAVYQGASSVTSGLGMPDKLWLGSGQYLRFNTTTALDAETTMTLYISYRSKFNKAAVTAVGAGISISSEVHNAV